jgi:inhibitor of KinA
MTPIFRPVADHALLVEFGTEITPEAYAKVRHLDAMLALHAPHGFLESVPAYVNILVEFDPILTDHRAIKKALIGLLSLKSAPRPSTTEREVLVCYEPAFAPDLPEVARLCGLSEQEVIAAHLAGDYAVFLYGFAPGYAYLAGVPQALHLPRKDAAIRDVAAGSVIIAAGQCLVTTLKMPTGWWIIGRSPTEILCKNPSRPFLFDVGDPVRFRRISAAEFATQQARI